MSPPPVPVSEKVARLRRTLLFSDLPPSCLRSLAGKAHAVEFVPGSPVVEEGEEGDALFVVTSGLLRVWHSPAGRPEILGEIHKGGFFGEFALLESTRRNATVEAVTPTQLLRLTRDDLQREMALHPDVEVRLRNTMKLRRTQGHPPFRPEAGVLVETLARMLGILDHGVLEAVQEELEWVWLPAGALLFREEDPADAMYLVIEGRLQLSASDDSSLLVDQIGPGETVGEEAILSSGPRAVSVRALLNSQLIQLPRATFDHLLASAPESMSSFRTAILERVVERTQKDAQQEGPTRRRITTDECEDVLATQDLVLRNLRITHSYHRLALDMADLLGYADVNWLAFGAHASRSAGHSIRKEEIPGSRAYTWLARSRKLGPMLKRVVGRFGRSPLVRVADGVLQSVSRAVSDGNLRIFSDMAPVMIRFLDLVWDDEEDDDSKMRRFWKELRPGPSERGGQDLLGAAISAWYEASQEADPGRKSQLILLGNLRLGLHEQTLVHPDLEEALGAPLRFRVGDEYARTVDALAAPLPGRLRRMLRRGAEALQRRALGTVTRIVRRVLTRRMMRLRLPDGELSLGGALPRLPDGSLYPPELQTLTHPELVELFGRFVSDPESPGRGAVDWASLDDRMAFIARLFRAQQRNPSLFTPPLDRVPEEA